MAIKFVTGSANKFAEVRAVLPDLERLECDLVEIQELDAQAIIVEDTSLHLDCLAGGALPGPLIKWFIKGRPLADLYDLARRFDDFGALARTVIGFTDATGAMRYFTGEVRGTVVRPHRAGAFGWDPLFAPRGAGNRTFDEMTAEEKLSLSMRGLAARQLKAWLDARAAG
jgi:XTP/dITP diphosphohydrolase